MSALLMSIALAQSHASGQEMPDPYRLALGRSGEVNAREGFVRTSDGTAVGIEAVVKSARGVQYVLVGENHETPRHHQLQADIVQALVDDGRHVIVGFEMFTRDKQAWMNPLTVGRVSVDEFESYADWKTQWGFAYSAYRPIFQVVADNRLPMAALNVPRDWIRQIGREGPSSVTAERRAWVPPLDLSQTGHRAVFESLMGGHPITGAQGENIYAAQVAWDTGMARSALDMMEGRDNRWVMVIMAGVGHVMFDQGINLRLKTLANEKSISVIALPAETERVSKGIGDFIYR